MLLCPTVSSTHLLPTYFRRYDLRDFLRFSFGEGKRVIDHFRDMDTDRSGIRDGCFEFQGVWLPKVYLFTSMACNTWTRAM